MAQLRVGIVAAPRCSTSAGATAESARAATSATSTQSCCTSRSRVGALRSSPTVPSAAAAEMRTSATVVCEQLLECVAGIVGAEPGQRLTRAAAHERGIVAEPLAQRLAVARVAEPAEQLDRVRAGGGLVVVAGGCGCPGSAAAPIESSAFAATARGTRPWTSAKRSGPAAVRGLAAGRGCGRRRGGRRGRGRSAPASSGTSASELHMSPSRAACSARRCARGSASWRLTRVTAPLALEVAGDRVARLAREGRCELGQDLGQRVLVAAGRGAGGLAVQQRMRERLEPQARLGLLGAGSAARARAAPTAGASTSLLLRSERGLLQGGPPCVVSIDGGERRSTHVFAYSPSPILGRVPTCAIRLLMISIETNDQKSTQEVTRCEYARSDPT